MTASPPVGGTRSAGAPQTQSSLGGSVTSTGLGTTPSCPQTHPAPCHNASSSLCALELRVPGSQRGRTQPRGVPAQGWCWGHSSELPLNVPPVPLVPFPLETLSPVVPSQNPHSTEVWVFPWAQTHPCAPPAHPPGSFLLPSCHFLAPPPPPSPPASPAPLQGQPRAAPQPPLPFPLLPEEERADVCSATICILLDPVITAITPRSHPRSS